MFIVLDVPVGFNLHRKVWKEYSGRQNILAHHTLSNIYMKRLPQNGPQRITMGTPSTDFVGVIFVRGNAEKRFFKPKEIMCY